MGSGIGFLVLGFKGSNFSFPLSENVSGMQCANTSCTFVVANFPETASRKWFYVEYERDIHFAHLNMTRDDFLDPGCLAYSSSNASLSIAKKLSYALSASEQARLGSLSLTLPCDPLLPLFFLSDRNLTIKPSSMVQLNLSPAYMEYYTDQPWPASLSYSETLASWFNMINYSSRAQFCLGFTDALLPNLFAVLFTRGADIGLYRRLSIVVESSWKLVLGSLLLVSGGVNVLLLLVVYLMYNKHSALEL